MRVANIILAHKNPAQLERLIKTMWYPYFDFYIHVDRKADLEPFRYLETIPGVYFIEDRMICNWGGFSLVETGIKSINQILASNIEYDFFNLLSAQDYPIKPVDEIYSFLADRLNYSFISFDSSNDTLWWQEAKLRYQNYHFTDLDFKGKYFIQKVVNMIMPKRKLPGSLTQLYGGNKSCWWTLSADCARYLSTYFKENPKIINFFKLTWAADEFLIPTILMNSRYRNQLINENYRYMQWSYGRAHPKILNKSDYAKIIVSDMLFARKFDENLDEEIMDMLDSTLLVHA